MQAARIDDVLIAIIVIGLLVSVVGMIVSVLNGRSSHVAHTKAASNLRALYDRTYRRTPFTSRRFVSIVRPVRTERRRQPAGDATPPKPPV